MAVHDPAGRLCELCSQALEAAEHSQTELTIDPFHENNAALEKSLNAGCPICTSLGYDAGQIKRFTHDVATVNKVGGCTDLSIGTRTSTYKSTTTREHKFVACKLEDDEFFFKQSERAYSEQSIGGDGSLNFAATLLKRCTELHRECVNNRHPLRYPTRLLDVEQDTIRLVDSRRTAISGPYATLSHTWGETHIKVLTSETLKDFSDGILLDDIPLTFKHAITVLRKLQIRYLWIDCYCIMQSSGSDDDEKVAEISRMGEIYSHAFINIGAGAATSPLDGIFNPKPRHCHPALQAISTPGDQKTSCMYLVYNQLHIGHDEHFYFQRDQNSIFGRAWCLQERFCCPRMLHFSKMGMIWECTAIENGSHRLPTQAFPVRLEGPNYIPFSIQEIGNKSRYKALHNWNTIVSLYSEMGLSRPDNDKLVACGAVAKAFADILHDRYIAGFFRESIMWSLAWIVTRKKEQESASHVRSRIWRAPTWSWASVDCRVYVSGIDTLDKSSGVLCSQLIGFDVELKDQSNPYGQLRSGMITVQGPVFEVDFDESRAKSSVWLENLEIKVNFDDDNEPRREMSILLIYVTETKGFVFPVMLPAERQLNGIVLARRTDSMHRASGTYCRVGAFNRQTFDTKYELRPVGSTDDSDIIRGGVSPIFNEADVRTITII